MECHITQLYVQTGNQPMEPSELAETTRLIGWSWWKCLVNPPIGSVSNMAPPRLLLNPHSLHGLKGDEAKPPKEGTKLEP